MPQSPLFTEDYEDLAPSFDLYNYTDSFPWVSRLVNVGIPYRYHRTHDVHGVSLKRRIRRNHKFHYRGLKWPIAFYQNRRFNNEYADNQEHQLSGQFNRGNKGYREKYRNDFVNNSTDTRSSLKSYLDSDKKSDQITTSKFLKGSKSSVVDNKDVRVADKLYMEVLQSLQRDYLTFADNGYNLSPDKENLRLISSVNTIQDKFNSVIQRNYGSLTRDSLYNFKNSGFKHFVSAAEDYYNNTSGFKPYGKYQERAYKKKKAHIIKNPPIYTRSSQSRYIDDEDSVKLLKKPSSLQSKQRKAKKR